MLNWIKKLFRKKPIPEPVVFTPKPVILDLEPIIHDVGFRIVKPPTTSKEIEAVVRQYGMLQRVITIGVCVAVGS